MNRRLVDDKSNGGRASSASNGTLPLFPDELRLEGAPAAEPQAVTRGTSQEEEAARIVASLSRGVESSEQVFEAFAALDELDADVVKAALRPWTGDPGSLEQLDDEIRRAHGFPPRTPRLRTRAIVRDADLLDLGSVAEEQLRIAGQRWDGRDLSAEERLDGEREDSFAGTVEHHTLVDADAPAGAPARFDVLLFAGDAGVIFRSGTTEILGEVSYGAVEMKDRALRDAIRAALEAKVVEPEPESVEEAVDAVEAVEPERSSTADVSEAAPSEPPVKKAAAKKAAAKEKTTAKKAGAKKAGAKKATAAKKVAAKKTAATKKATATKKAAAETTASTTKASAKKTAATKKTAASTKKAAASTKKAAASTKKAAASTKKAAALTKKASAKKAATKKAAAPKSGATKKKAAAPKA